MARRIVHQLVDDLDGTILDIGEGETVMFSLDGTAYEIDLTTEHAAALRDALAPYRTAGRALAAPGGRNTPSPRSTGGRSAGSPAYLAAVREWARNNGFTVSDRGRVPANVLAAYEASR